MKTAELVGLVFCAALSSSAGATLMTSAFLDVPAEGFSETESSTSNTAPFLGDAVGFPPPGDVSSINPAAEARAFTAGILQARLKAEAFIPGDTGSTELDSSGNAKASWSTQATIRADGIDDGEKGKARAQMRFDGALSYKNNGFGEFTIYSAGGFVSAELNVAGETNFRKYEGGYSAEAERLSIAKFRVNRASPSGNDFIDKDGFEVLNEDSFGWDVVFGVEFDFEFGEPFDVSAILLATGQSDVTSSGRLEWESSALNTSIWNGLTEVRTSTGEAVSSFTAFSTELLDLANPASFPDSQPPDPDSQIPVPGAVWLLWPGLAYLGTCKRLKSS